MPDRNPKVRRRLAAGKLRLRLCDLRNLGPRSVRLLGEIGIRTPEELRSRGALQAYLELRRAGSIRSLNLLWALVGAIEPWPEGRDWREVAASDARLPLLLAVDEAGGPRVTNGKAMVTGNAAPGEPAFEERVWVPGMPFDVSPSKPLGARRVKKKNRP